MKTIFKLLLLLSCIAVLENNLHARLAKPTVKPLALPKAIKDQLANVKAERHSKKKSDCLETFKICEVPAVISQPGKWFVCKDLTYTGTGAAIIIAANNVTLDFNEHDLTLTQDGSVGVLAQDVREIVIKNDAIIGVPGSSSSTSAALQFIGCADVIIENIFTTNTASGIRLDVSELNPTTNVTVKNCHLLNHNTTGAGGAAYIRSLSAAPLNNAGLFVENCYFSGNTGSIDTSTSMIEIIGSFDTQIRSSIFANSSIAIAFFGDGLLVDNCQISGDITNTFNLVQVGDTNTPQAGNNVIIRNTTVQVAAPAEGNVFFDGIIAGFGSGLLIENVIIDTQARGGEGFPVVGAIHLGGDQPALAAPAQFNDVKILNTIIKNANDNGILSEGESHNLIVDNVTIEQAVSSVVATTGAIHFFGTNGSTVKNSLIANNNTDGILLEAAGTSGAPAANNTIVGNTIARNTPNGVELTTGSLRNAVVNNIFTGNGTPIVDNGTLNVTAPNIFA